MSAANYRRHSRPLVATIPSTRISADINSALQLAKCATQPRKPRATPRCARRPTIFSARDTTAIWWSACSASYISATPSNQNYLKLFSLDHSVVTSRTSLCNRSILFYLQIPTQKSVEEQSLGTNNDARLRILLYFSPPPRTYQSGKKINGQLVGISVNDVSCNVTCLRKCIIFNDLPNNPRLCIASTLFREFATESHERERKKYRRILRAAKMPASVSEF